MCYQIIIKMEKTSVCSLRLTSGLGHSQNHSRRVRKEKTALAVPLLSHQKLHFPLSYIKTVVVKESDKKIIKAKRVRLVLLVIANREQDRSDERQIDKLPDRNPRKKLPIRRRSVHLQLCWRNDQKKLQGFVQ